MGIKLDGITKIVLWISAILLLILTGATFTSLFIGSKLAIKEFGWRFLISSQWDPVSKKFGILPFIIGSFSTSIISLLISLPISLSLALLLGFYLPNGAIHNIISYATDLLAGIPSVIYGFWGITFLIPIVRRLEIKFGITPYGVGIFTASLILAIMIIPYTCSVAREVIRMVPKELIEAGFALGATRYDVIRKVILPYASSGIISGILFAFGRAFGETMAVTMVIGNNNSLPQNIFSPGNTMPSLIANEFTEATADIHLSSLIYVGLCLFMFTFIINLISLQVIKISYQDKPV